MESCAHFGTLIPETSFKLEVEMQKSEPCSFGCDSSCQPTPLPPPALPPAALFREYTELGSPIRPAEPERACHIRAPY